MVRWSPVFCDQWKLCLHPRYKYNFYFWILHPVACMIRLLETPSLAIISIVVCFIISHCRYMFRPLFGHPHVEYTIVVIGNYYTRNSSRCSVFYFHYMY
jgi:uncharacterized membrane protein